LYQGKGGRCLEIKQVGSLAVNLDFNRGEARGWGKEKNNAETSKGK
jgi:hypothetical protein